MRTLRARGVEVLVCLIGAACESKKVPEPPAPPPAPAFASATPSASATAASTRPAPGIAASPDEPPMPSTEPVNALPTGVPRFAWKSPSSVAVVEDVAQQGQHMKFGYRLDVCPNGGGGILVSHRDVTVKEISGVPVTGKDRTPEVRQIEAAASSLPTMVVDRTGNFLHGAGYPEMIERTTAAFPGDEFAQLRSFLASGQAPAVLDMTLEQLWQGWVAVWLRFDPARGATQDTKDVDAGPGASLTHLSYAGSAPEHRVRLSAHRVPTQEELIRLAGVTGTKDRDVPKTATLDWEVETDWPDVRPWRVRSRRSVTMMVEGNEQTGAEEHTYTFDWRSSAPPVCAKGR